MMTSFPLRVNLNFTKFYTGKILLTHPKNQKNMTAETGVALIIFKILSTIELLTKLKNM